MFNFYRQSCLAAGFCCAVGIAGTAGATVTSVVIDGPDAIFLAGRTDLVIPSANLSWTGPGDFLTRHPGPTPEETQETLPPMVSVSGGDVVKVLDPTIGGIDFFNGIGLNYFGPSGNGLSGSNLSSLGGISGYKGPQGPLVGVFLDNSIPNGVAPGTLDFTAGGLGINFASIAPSLGQIFYIGDGVDGLAQFQEFIAPAGATRLFLGIPDGFGFVGHPGAYDDNDGSYKVRIGVNEIPVRESAVPEPASLLLGGLALAGIGCVTKRRK